MDSAIKENLVTVNTEKIRIRADLPATAARRKLDSTQLLHKHNSTRTLRNCQKGGAAGGARDKRGIAAVLRREDPRTGALGDQRFKA
jgi:hypothetical protein